MRYVRRGGGGREAGARAHADPTGLNAKAGAGTTGTIAALNGAMSGAADFQAFTKLGGWHSGQ